jgi:phospholipid transport system transporter-binding protein
MSSAVSAATGREAAAGVFRLVAGTDGRFAAAGPLTFATARQARALGELTVARAAAGAAVEIACAGITASDSAGLAVLLDWLGAARRTGRTLRYTQLPAGITALARISEVEGLLQSGA